MKTRKFTFSFAFKTLVISACFVVGSCTPSSSNNNSSDETKVTTKDEISGVYVTFENTLASDGEWDSEGDYGNPIKKDIVVREVDKDNEIFYCYDTQHLIKIEILGYIKNANIDYKENGSEKIISLLENKEINGQFVISPTGINNHLNGGKIIIKGDNEVLREVEIHYDGCL